MYKQKNKQTGITLIALVVTLIVLIILSGVSISMLLGDNGIITQAQRADESTIVAKEKEEISLAWQSIELARKEENSLEPVSDEELKQQLITSGQAEDGIEVTGDTGILKVTYKTSENSYIVTQAGKVVEENKLGDIVEIGDYIEYNPGEGNVYVSEAHTDSEDIGNGVKDYTFTSSNDTKWRVWDITEEGNIRIISEDILYTNGLAGEKLCFNGKNGWKQASNELDKICSIYGHGVGAESATSINEEDIRKIVQWTEPDSSTGQYYGNTFTYYSSYSENTYNDTKGEYAVFEMLDGRVPTNENPIVIENHMWRPLITKDNLTLDNSKKDIMLELLKGNYKGTNQWESLYWISGNQPYYATYNFVIYNVYLMISRMQVGSTTVTRTDRNDGDFIEMGIRPIVTLKSNLKYESGNGQVDDAIRFVDNQ